MLCYYGDDMEEYRRWEDNIKMNLKEIGVDVMNLIELFRDIYHCKTFLNAALNIVVPRII